MDEVWEPLDQVEGRELEDWEEKDSDSVDIEEEDDILIRSDEESGRINKVFQAMQEAESIWRTFYKDNGYDWLEPPTLAWDDTKYWPEVYRKYPSALALVGEEDHSKFVQIWDIGLVKYGKYFFPQSIFENLIDKKVFQLVHGQTNLAFCCHFEQAIQARRLTIASQLYLNLWRSLAQTLDAKHTTIVFIAYTYNYKDLHNLGIDLGIYKPTLSYRLPVEQTLRRKVINFDAQSKVFFSTIYLMKNILQY